MQILQLSLSTVNNDTKNAPLDKTAQIQGACLEYMPMLLRQLQEAVHALTGTTTTTTEFLLSIAEHDIHFV